ncbi:MAG: molybdopterin molybdotransferase MoeA [Halodesulfurarchaeum sp.]|nr:molybdopterin molybdotransferase MoeA [Halodesulfurarchaeum sp.]
MTDSDRDRLDGGPTPIAEAVAVLEDQLGPIDRTETVPIGEAKGQVLPNAIVADRNLPAYRRSERDGYAVRAADTTDAAGTEPSVFSTTTGAIGTGETAYVHTGSAVPEGADAVVMIENVSEMPEEGAKPETDGQSGNRIKIRAPVESGAYVTPIGADLQTGTSLFEAGHRLRPGDLGALKLAGVRKIPVLDAPTVAVIPTGEELVQSDPDPGEVVETNGLVGSTQVEQWCGTARYRDVVTDEESALQAAIERDLDADLIVTTGGSSVGSRDLLPSVVADRGEVLIRGLALRPGHSAGFGVVSGTPIAMLPGTPIASLVVASLVVRPALATAVGTQPVDPPTVQATLETELHSEAGRRTVHGVTLDNGGGQTDSPVARTAERGGLPSLTGIDGWVQVAESSTELTVGESVPVERWGVSFC